MTPRRYIDWTFSTPIMLISTVVFMKYQEFKDLKFRYALIDTGEIDPELDYVYKTPFIVPLNYLIAKNYYSIF